MGNYQQDYVGGMPVWGQRGGTWGFGNVSGGTSSGAGGRGGGFQDVQLPPGINPARPIVERPDLGTYQPPSRGDLDTARQDVNMFRSNYADPTHTQAYQDVMTQASMATARQAEETSRLGQEAAMRRGFVGGGGGVASERAARERMRALAGAGVEASIAAREEALKGYGSAMGTWGGLAQTYMGESAQTARQYAADLAKARELQGQLDLGWGSQRIEANRDLASRLLDQGRLREEGRWHDLQADIEDRKMGWQGQADLMQKIRLEEEKRQFDLKMQMERERLEAEMGLKGRDIHGRPIRSPSSPFGL